ncbi:hypothetical protein [Moritella dasanensis]|nr:hypothetical protein [Moritella dasanensis]
MTQVVRRKARKVHSEASAAAFAKAMKNVAIPLEPKGSNHDRNSAS